MDLEVVSLSPYSGPQETPKDSTGQWGEGTGEKNWTCRFLGQSEHRVPRHLWAASSLSTPICVCALTQGPWDCPHGPDQLCSLKGMPSYLAWELSSQTLFPWLRGWRPEHKTSFLEGQAWASASQWGKLTATFLIHWGARTFPIFFLFLFILLLAYTHNKS